MNIKFEVAQLLVSRICHDLAGGISALSTGSELLLEEEEGADRGTLDLIALSARQSSHRLQFLRVAFGFGGGQGGTCVADDLEKLTRNYLEGGRVSLVWSDDRKRLELAHGKLLLNLCLIASEALPRGGTVEVVFSDLEGGLGFAVAAKGDGARLLPEIQDAMTVDASKRDMTSRTVHGHYTAILAAQLGAPLEIIPGGKGGVCLATLIPSV